MGSVYLGRGWKDRRADVQGLSTPVPICPGSFLSWPASDTRLELSGCQTVSIGIESNQPEDDHKHSTQLPCPESSPG